MDTPTTVISRWDAPNTAYGGDSEEDATSVDLNIASLERADSGVYSCSANVVDSSDNKYIADSTIATAFERIIISKMKCLQCYLHNVFKYYTSLDCNIHTIRTHFTLIIVCVHFFHRNTFSVTFERSRILLSIFGKHNNLSIQESF